MKAKNSEDQKEYVFHLTAKVREAILREVSNGLPLEPLATLGKDDNIIVGGQGSEGEGAWLRIISGQEEAWWGYVGAGVVELGFLEGAPVRVVQVPVQDQIEEAPQRMEKALRVSGGFLGEANVESGEVGN